MGVSSRALDDVIDKVRHRHYQVIRKCLRCLGHSLLVWFSYYFITLQSEGALYCKLFLQLACTLTFEAVHGTSCDAGINHPNQYFSDSQKVLESKVICVWNLEFSVDSFVRTSSSLKRLASIMECSTKNIGYIQLSLLVFEIYPVTLDICFESSIFILLD